jgi:2-dehydro-3-deoxygluconokinase
MTHELHTRRWLAPTVLGIGEAMLEFAATGGDSYRRGFAGDTLNTCWHLAALLGDVNLMGQAAQVGYCTRVGTDPFSDELITFIEAGGMHTRHISRDAERTLGLYVIRLEGAERHFSYWRDQSAARRLADDPAALAAAVQGGGLVHVSGITLAVIGESGRHQLIAALREARRAGTVVSFDPNVRWRLWRDEAELRAAMLAMLEVVDIALPSFDDEARLWGDAGPQATLERLERAGVAEIVVKDGAQAVVHGVQGRHGRVATPPVEHIIDTTGAGDAFNAGYLGARLVGLDAAAAVRLGQRVAGEVIGHYGALAPRKALADLRSELAAQAGAP